MTIKLFIQKIFGTYMIPILALLTIYFDSEILLNFLIFYGWVYIPAIIIIVLVLLYLLSQAEPDEALDNMTKKNDTKAIKYTLKLASRKHFYSSFWFMFESLVLLFGIGGLVYLGHIVLSVFLVITFLISFILGYIFYEFSKKVAEEYEKRLKEERGNDE